MDNNKKDEFFDTWKMCHLDLTKKKCFFLIVFSFL